MARLGLFGGTFNPIHVGHLMIAAEARQALALDEVLFIPSGNSYLKDPAEIAPRAARLEMTRLAVATLGAGFGVSDVEIRREGPSYTRDTLAEFAAARPGDRLFLILGADSILEIETWREPAEIFRLATVIAFTRGGSDTTALRVQAEALRARFDARIELIETFSLAVSSSDIRRWIRTGHAFAPLVTAPVAGYIRAEGLYKSNPQ